MNKKAHFKSTKNPNIALISTVNAKNHNVLWKIGFCTAAVLFPGSQERLRVVMTHRAAIRF